MVRLIVKVMISVRFLPVSGHGDTVPFLPRKDGLIWQRWSSCGSKALWEHVILWPSNSVVAHKHPDRNKGMWRVPQNFKFGWKKCVDCSGTCIFLSCSITFCIALSLKEWNKITLSLGSWWAPINSTKLQHYSSHAEMNSGKRERSKRAWPSKH